MLETMLSAQLQPEAEQFSLLPKVISASMFMLQCLNAWMYQCYNASTQGDQWWDRRHRWRLHRLPPGPGQGVVLNVFFV